MTSLRVPGLLVTLILMLVVTCCIMSERITGHPLSVDRRATHRYPRAKYRVGYMFGKRSDAELTSSAMFDAVSRNVITKQELESLILSNPSVASEVATILDKNDDGVISVSDFL